MIEFNMWAASLMQMVPSEEPGSNRKRKRALRRMWRQSFLSIEKVSVHVYTLMVGQKRGENCHGKQEQIT